MFAFTAESFDLDIYLSTETKIIKPKRAMIAITTISSIKVNPFKNVFWARFCEIVSEGILF